MQVAQPRARVARRKNLELLARVSRFALCPANPPVLQAKESLKDFGVGNTLESLSLGRPTKRAKIASYRYYGRKQIKTNSC